MVLASLIPVTAAAQRTPPQDSSGRAEGERAGGPAGFALAEATLQKLQSGPDGKKPDQEALFRRQRASLAAAENLIRLSAAPDKDQFIQTLAIGREATLSQGRVFGPVADNIASVPAISPGEGSLSLMDRHGVLLSEAQRGQLLALNDLDEAPRAALGRFLSAFIAFEDASKVVFGQQSGAQSTAIIAARTAAGLPGSSPDAVMPTMSAMDLRPVLAARLGLIDAAAEVAETFGSIRTSSSEADTPPDIQIPPVLAIDLAGKPSTYTDNFALQLDVGGHDRYLNNAGGNGYLLPHDGSACGLPGPAAALVDLAGDDRYGVERDCGANGGGRGGSGFLIDKKGRDIYMAGMRATNGGGEVGSGFILDAEGDDSYKGGRFFEGRNYGGAVNGGALNGMGTLIDGAGNDEYAGGDVGVNGGAGSGGYGLLFDQDGDDLYEGSNWGVNGGGKAADGLLIDAAGDDIFRALHNGVNGGGDGNGTGLLLNLGGDDSYVAGDKVAPEGGAGNGGARDGLGLLLDSGGNDFYNDVVENCWNCTKVPKGALGAQVDGGAGVVVTISDAEVSEGSGSESPQAEFTVSLDAPSAVPVTVEFETADGTAQAGQDYLAAKGKVVFDPGETSEAIELSFNGNVSSPEGRLDRSGEFEKKLPVSVVGDSVPEATESFVLNLSNPSNAVITDRQGIGTIVNDDGPGLSINDISITEGDSGVTSASFNVALTGPAASAVTVAYAFEEETADDPTDYVADDGVLTFQPGETTRSIEVRVKGDSRVEDFERFRVQLSDLVNATFLKSRGTGTIVNDDMPPVSILDTSVFENDNEQAFARFPVKLAAPYNREVTIDFETKDATATGGLDYQPQSGKVVFKSGESSQVVSVPVLGDAERESDEKFLTILKNAANAAIEDPEAVGTIRDDADGEGGIEECSNRRPRIFVNDATISEGDQGTSGAAFAVSLDCVSKARTEVSFGTRDETAEAPHDYTQTSGSLVFGPGARFKFIEVPVMRDAIDEENETFVLELSESTNGVVEDAQAIGTIIDDDGAIDAAQLPGGVAVIGHDSDDHVFIGHNVEGALNIIRRAVGYVTLGKPDPRLLYVTGGSRPEIGEEAGLGRPVVAVAGLGNEGGALEASGFKFVEVAAAGGVGGVHDLNTVDFASYDAVVVACSNGCGLGQADLDSLIGRRRDLINHINSGKGLVAFEESGLKNQFAFLPVLAASASHEQEEAGYRVTPVGRTIGLTDADVNGNISHNYFAPAGRCGYDPIDLDNLGRPISLGARVRLGNEGCAEGRTPDEKRATGESDGPDGFEPAIPPHEDFKPAIQEELPNRSGVVTSVGAPFNRYDQLGSGHEVAASSREQNIVPLPPGLSQPGVHAQSQIEFQLQGQAQIQRGINLQHQISQQAQSTGIGVKEREAQLQVAREEAPVTQGGQYRKQTTNTHLASSRQALGGSRAAATGMTAVALALFALFWPTDRQAPLALNFNGQQKAGCRRVRHQPRHRRR